MHLTPRGRVVFKFSADLAAWIAAGAFAFLLRLPVQWPSAEVMALYLGVGVLVKSVAILWGKLERHSWQQTTVPDLLHMAEVVALGTVDPVRGRARDPCRRHRVPPHGPDHRGHRRRAPDGVGPADRPRGRRPPDAPDHARGMAAAPGPPGRRRPRGAQLVRDFRQHPRERIEPVGFLDDEPVKQKLVLARLPVLGTIDDLPRIVAEERIEEVLITMPTAPGSRVREVLDLSAQAGVQCPDPARRSPRSWPATWTSTGCARCRSRTCSGVPSSASTWTRSDTSPGTPCSSRAPAARSVPSSCGSSRSSAPARSCCSTTTRTRCTRSATRSTASTPACATTWSSAASATVPSSMP